MVPQRVPKLNQVNENNINSQSSTTNSGQKKQQIDITLHSTKLDYDVDYTSEENANDESMKQQQPSSNLDQVPT